MHVTGPRGGRMYPLNAIAVSDSCLELDWLFCAMIGLDPLATPLFQAVEADRRRQLAAACRGIIERPDFRAAEGFRLSYQIHISFGPWNLGRSALQTLRFKLREGILSNPDN